MVKHFEMPYGNLSIDISIPENRNVEIIEPNRIENNFTSQADIYSDIINVLSSPGSQVDVLTNSKIVIVVNDKTRPVPNDTLIPPLLKVLKEKGVKSEQIKFIIASGTHTPMRSDEYYLILPDEIRLNYEISSHNCDDKKNLSYKGVTSRGTPVHVNSLFNVATLKIVVGDIEPHHFAGFSGGVKSAAIGLCGRETINTNHKYFTNENAKVGVYQNNPLRQDIEDIGKIIGVDFALNAILDEEKNILKVYFGKPLDVMKEGIKFSRSLSFIPITKYYDFVIASAGGYPKDINFYQAQKALTHASLFCKTNSMVFLVAECNEGIGNEKYAQFMKGLSSHSEAITKFNSVDFEVGPHKAYQVAKIASKIRFKLFSSISHQQLKDLLIEPILSLDEEVIKYIDLLPSNANILLLPHATATLPEFSEEK